MNQKNKIRVGLFFGGKSQEREVSLKSAESIAGHFLDDKYEIIPIEISKDGKWLLETDTTKQISKKVGHQQKEKILDLLPIEKDSGSGIDVAFLIIHGPGGEDGTIQGMLELMNIPYTGSGVLASALAMDKAKAKRMVTTINIPILPHLLLNKFEFSKNRDKIIETIKDTVVIKPNQLGSSLGIVISSDKAEISQAIEDALKHSNEVIVEPFLAGREITVPVLGNDSPRAFSPVEILPQGDSKFYDYEAKYNEGGSKHVIPASLDEELSERVKTQATNIHKLLGCKGVSRVDFILGEDGNFYFLEINTIPGMTPTSLVPEAAKHDGVSFSKLLDTLIELALQKSDDENL